MEQLTVSQKIEYSTKDISKIAREQLKKDFPNCTFSVTRECYSGGSSITLSLMKADFPIVKKFEELSEQAIRTAEYNRYTVENLKALQDQKYHQLNHFTLMKEYDADSWCNGVFLTEQAHKVLQRAVNMIQHYNWDNSDAQVDYFDVHFYLHVQIGKYDKPFEEMKSL